VGRFLKIGIVVSLFFVLGCKNREKNGSKNKTISTVEMQFKEKFHEANNQKMIGHFDKSIELFEACLVIDPNSAASYFGLSEIYAKQNNTNKALELAQKSVDLNAKNKWYVTHLADLYHSVGNYHKSAKYYESMFDDFDEKNIDYRYKLVESLVYSNQNQKAIDAMNMIELETGKTPQLSLTKHDMYNAMGKKQLADKEIESLLNEYPTNEDVRNTILDYYLQTNQVDKGKLMAEEILSLNPDNGNALLGLADIEIRHNNIDKSFDYLERGFVLNDVEIERKLALLNGLTSFAFDRNDPNSKLIRNRLDGLYDLTAKTESDNPSFLSLYGTFLDARGKKYLARQQYKKAVKINPGDYNAWDGLLNADYNAKLYDSLFVDGEKSLEVFPTQPMNYLLTGIGAYESGKYVQAEEYLTMGENLVVRDKEMRSEFEYHLGKSAWMNGQKSDANNYFDSAIELYPKNAKVYHGRALFLKRENKTKQAIEYIKKAIEIDSKNEFYLDTYGLLLLEDKHIDNAVTIFEKAILIDFKNPIILDHYGDALYFKGEVNKAVEIWKEAKKQGSKSAVIDIKIADKKFYENK